MIIIVVRPICNNSILKTLEGGEAPKREGGGHMKLYTYEKGGGGKGLTHAEGGAQKVLG